MALFFAKQKQLFFNRYHFYQIHFFFRFEGTRAEERQLFCLVYPLSKVKKYNIYPHLLDGF